ncbi:MAG: NERD domain-containing protein [Syntrophobacteraceae bacterium]|nr:NERD domain-containing protein [Syntrophobacteraceae bacterium]
MTLGFLKSKKTPKKSPLKARPLRNAGQSLDEKIHTIISEEVGSYAAAFAIASFAILYEWMRWYSKFPPHPVVITLAMGPIALYALARILLYRRRLKILRQARDGEKAVGQYLETLREKGYRVFHDVIGNGFNIDHVIIGAAGVFTIETKTISKPERGSCEIVYDGEKVAVNGFTPDRDPIVQAKAEAGWLREFIQDSAGRAVKVRPVVLYPGWYISRQPKGAEVWVLNPRNLPAFLDHERTVLASEDVKLLAFHLSRYVREGSITSFLTLGLI